MKNAKGAYIHEWEYFVLVKVKFLIYTSQLGEQEQNISNSSYKTYGCD